jgi:hypothetical protein
MVIHLAKGVGVFVAFLYLMDAQRVSLNGVAWYSISVLPDIVNGFAPKIQLGFDCSLRRLHCGWGGALNFKAIWQRNTGLNVGLQLSSSNFFR